MTYRTLTYTEKQFQADVRRLAALTGWACFMTYRSTHSPEGWPDLTLVRPPRIVAAELKSAKGKLSESQIITLTLLSECPGVEPYCWWPADWAKIERVLA